MKRFFEFFRRLAGSAVAPALDETDRVATAEAPTKRSSFARPRIALIDISNEVGLRLTERGYANLRICSFGAPYIDRTPDAWVRPVLNGRVSDDFAESDLFIIDMFAPSSKKERRELTDGALAPLMMRRSSFEVDPRPLAMQAYSRKLDRALQAGSVFVIFADEQVRLSVADEPEFFEFSSHGQEVSMWSVLPILGHLDVRADSGREMQIIAGPEKLRRLLLDYCSDSSFTCTFEPIRIHGRDTHLVPGWETIATNRFGVPVAGLIRDESSGVVILLPRIVRKTEFLTELVADVLPSIALHLYPHLQRLEWTTDASLDLPSLRAMKLKLQEVNDAHALRINELAEAIERHRSDIGHLATLLTASGDELRMAVKKTLEDFGFAVVDVDEERGQTGATPDREDLRIDDSKPALLIETKGLTGHPSDEDAHQVLKYVPLRREELGREDIAALTIVNHQRMLSPWERDPKAFRPEILANAKARTLGLLTTWDLYRLARNARTLNWPVAALRATMFGTGRIDPIPAHYVAVGKVERVLDKLSVVSIRAESSAIVVGDRLAFESGIDFMEFIVTSMQVDKSGVDRAEIGTLAGVRVSNDVVAAARVGVRVFRRHDAAFT